MNQNQLNHRLRDYFTPNQKNRIRAFSYTTLFFGPVALLARKQIRSGIIHLALYFFLAFHFTPDLLILATNLPVALVANWLRSRSI